MRIQEVEYLIGKDNMNKFNDFMIGKTLGLGIDGTEDFYKWDVQDFMRKNGINKIKV